MKRISKVLKLAAAGIALALILEPALAQQTLEEIVVTARKRSESLQEIPESVTVIDSDLVEVARISNIKDFSVLVPNLHVSTNFRQGLSFVTIRGLITPQVGEAPIAFVVDGVTVPNLEFINQDLDQIERIEVLRGPQGALYGKNAIGGAINIITKQPGEELEGYVDLSLGEGNDRRIAASIGGPLAGNSVRFRLSADYRDFDGLITNGFLDEKVDYVDGAAGVRGLLAVDIDEASSIALHGRYRDTTQGTNYMSFITLGQLNDFSIGPTQNAVGIDEQEIWTVSAKYDRELPGGGLLTAIAGLNHSRDDQFSDADFTSLPAVDANFFFPSTQINLIEEDSLNLEARISSPDDAQLRWLAGAFFETRDRIVQFDQIFDDPGTARVTLADAKPLLVNSNDHDPADLWVSVFPTDGERTNQDTSAFAFFGQVNYDLSDALELTLALRYDEEERKAIDERVRFTEDSRVEDTFSELQPKVSAAWSFADNALASFTWSRGFRSGGFNEYAPTVTRFYGKEVSDTFEAGVKTSWLDDRLTLNGAAFYITQDNAQFTRFNSTTFTLENLNVQEVEISGFEAELVLRATDAVDFRFGFGVIDNEITKNSGIDPYTGLDLAQTVGNTMPYVSDYNFTASVDFNQPLANGRWLRARLSGNAMGPRSFDIFNDLTGESDSRFFADASIGLYSDDWTISLYASNLTDEDAAETVFFYNPLIRFPNQPRQVGIRARYML
ncbi:MAG: TonB-dependent receptor [Gammaproteobacteria bacterium]|nr:TonB-dependent receptor [Gammaproteobacteria bacterium]MXW45743.1 TonB-dependent receptor [Gammaproteobacteria bacterium]MYD03107.1 TonB-dependent receptor [Gammaproteobacteria bacterium]MYI25730.1 TonB-dependent receptor [Gammaproteobacteria bacterium]